MYKELLPIIRCPKCNSAFRLEALLIETDEIVEGFLVCNEGHKYSIHKGVVDFCSNEQGLANQWSESYKETDYETYDRQIEEMKTDVEKYQQQMMIDRFVVELSDMKHGTVVDIASGRGMLITKLAAHLNNPVNLIATDLSFEVLMYDRFKLKKINPSLRANYVACDATALPFIKNCADFTISFYGIANMLGIVENGICEAERITKHGGKLLNASMVVEKDSKGITLVKQICLENGAPGAEVIYLQKEATELHRKYFGKVDCQIISEATKDENENKTDLLPYPNEWYAQVIFSCTKAEG